MKKYFGIISFIILSSMLHAQYTQEGNKLVGTGALNAFLQGWSVAISADGNTAIAGGYNDKGGVGAAWIYTKTNGVWTQQGNKLVGTGAIGDSYQGWSVAISGDGNTAIVGGYEDNTTIGAAWIYTRKNGIWTQQGTKLHGTDAVGYANQGCSVSISFDGNTAIVGGSCDNGGRGAAWVYTRTNGVWTQQGNKLVSTDAVGNAGQGYSVSISSDGNTAILGGSNVNLGCGAAWVYTRTNGVWIQQGNMLVGAGAVGNGFRLYSVSISGDGNTAIAGNYNDNDSTGAAWIFTRTNGIWTQQGDKLVGSGAEGIARQGYSVSISGDGNTAIVGGPDDNSSAGAAWIYKRTNGIWTQQGNKIVGTDAEGNAVQGQAVSVSGDGNTAIVGGCGDNTNLGASWIFKRTNGVWTQQGNKLFGTGGLGDACQGYSVSVSSDGNTAIAGGYHDNSYAGAAWVFSRQNGIWTQQGNKLVGRDAVGTSYQGRSVSISSDGNTAIVGGSSKSLGTGAVWVFARRNGVWSQQGNKLIEAGAAGDIPPGYSVAISGDGNTAIVGASDDNNQAGAVWIFTRTNGLWTQQGNKLFGTGAVGNAEQGYSVSISADGNTAIVGGSRDNSSRGAAWIFTRQNGVWNQQGNKLEGTDAAPGAFQGYSVSISGDGNTAVMGSINGTGSGGAVWVFTRTNGVWTQQGDKLVGTGSTGWSSHGRSVSVSSDGNKIITGGYFDNNQTGAVWIYTRTNGVWTQLGNKLVGTGAAGKSEQGWSVSISSNGSTIIAGGISDDYSQGAAWIFTAPFPSQITASSGVNGSVTPSGVTTVQYGASQTYSMQPDGGYEVQDVLVDGVSVGDVSTYTFANVTSHHTISVTFTEAGDHSVPVPEIAYPANGIMVYTNSPVAVWYTLNWMPELKYQAQAASDAAFTNVVFNKTGISSLLACISGLSSRTQYYLRVRGITTQGKKGAWSQTAVFSTVTAPGQIPIVPNMVYPAGGAEVYTDRPVFVWYIPEYGPGLKFYLQLSTTADFSNIVVNQSGITNTVYTVPGLSAGAVYYARVRSYTPQGLHSDFSPAESFTVNQLFGTRALTPIIAYPRGGNTVYTTTLVMTWTIPGYSPNENYNLQVSTRPDFQTFVLNRENIPGFSCTLNGLVYGTTYYARIRGRVGTGAYSLFSAVEPFTVISADWLNSPIPGSPVEEVLLTSPGALLSWYMPSSEGQQEVRYDLQISNDAGFTMPQTINAISGQSYNLQALKSDSKYYWRVRSRTEDGKISAYSNEGVFITGKVITGISEKNNGEVKDYSLKQNYPNPFNPVTTIEFSVKNNGWARLEVIDILGKVIKTLVNEDLQAGTYTVTMNGQGMSSGIYFYKLTTPDRQIINKMILSK